MKKIALFPGTFDPPSLGHLDIIQRASKICDQLYVGVATNRHKSQTVFTIEEKVELLCRLTKDIPEVQVVSFNALVVDFSKAHGIGFLIRGLRADSDLNMNIAWPLRTESSKGWRLYS